MVADDLAANGIETVNLSNILDVDLLDSDIVDQLMRGLHDAANFANISITGGEIAELGNRIGGYGNRMHFNWCATGIGILPPGKEMIDGKNIQVGDQILALKSRGYRSNGFSLLRRIMDKCFGPEWHNHAYNKEMSWGKVLLTPSLIYTPLIANLVKNEVKINGIAHITGGGIADNLSRILKRNHMGANLNDIFDPLPVMKKVQELGDISEDQAYQLWNMGNGMLLIVNPDQTAKVLKIIDKTDYQARICGEVVDESNIKIDSKGNHPQRLTY